MPILPEVFRAWEKSVRGELAGLVGVSLSFAWPSPAGVLIAGRTDVWNWGGLLDPPGACGRLPVVLTSSVGHRRCVRLMKLLAALADELVKGIVKLARPMTVRHVRATIMTQMTHELST